MPYVLPASLRSGKVALVLAFGKLSVLEACSTLQDLGRIEEPCERVCVAECDSSSRLLTQLAGIHKFAPLLLRFSGDEEEIRGFVRTLASEVDVEKFAISGYEVPDDDYEELLRAILDGLRDEGLKKIRLLRPKGNELLAEEVSSRGALDVIAFPYQGGYALGPTAWVADKAAIRKKNMTMPSPVPQIAMSPRLARTLVNIAGLAPGKTLLDPFCGTGTILAEGLSKSLVCIGVDSDPRRIRDARRNLEWAKRQSKGRFTLKVGDATALPSILGEAKVDAVVTEPVLLPGLKSRPTVSVAAELMEAAGETYARSLASIAEVLEPGGRVVMVAPVLLTIDGGDVSVNLDAGGLGLRLFQPGKVGFRYPVRLSFESTRWVRRSVYVFESRP